MPDTPSLTIGARGIADPVVENLNVLISGSPLRYHYIKDGLAVAGNTVKHDLPGNGLIIGFDVNSEGREEGTVDLQLNRATDVAPVPGHILRITKGASIKYYGVTTGPDGSEAKNVKRPSPGLLQILEPIFTGLLSQDLGDTKQLTYSIATMATTETLATSPVNHRTGATKTYSATQADGSALPTGVTIDSSTGIISSVKATVLAGVYTIKVLASDVLATLPANHPQRTLLNEQTLILTITA